MEKLIIKATKLTPEVVFDPECSLISIKGVSLPEDVHKFYEKILLELDDFINNFHSDRLNVIINFLYFNSSSIRYINEMFKNLSKIKNEKNINLNIQWHYEKGDDLLKEVGEELEELTGLKFKFIET